MHEPNKPIPSREQIRIPTSRIPLSSSYRSSDCATGVFFFHRDGRNLQCTASLVDSTNHLIVTTAQCLHGGKGHNWSQNGVFIPAYAPGKDNVGYPVRTQRVFTDWISSGTATLANIKNDVGFATVIDMPSPSSLSQFGSYHVGHSGLTTFSAHITSFPHDPGNNKIKYSYDATTHFVLGHTDAIQVNTGFKDSSGSSGSPWVQSETIVGNTG